MSLISWKEEFFHRKLDNIQTWSEIEIIDHSILKWEGLRQENLNRHKVRLDKYLFHNVVDSRPQVCPAHVPINSDSCALCERWYGNTNEDYRNNCHSCPLYQLGYGCEERDSPWRQFDVRDSNPDPELMIRALKETKEWLLSGLTAAEFNRKKVEDAIEWAKTFSEEEISAETDEAVARVLSHNQESIERNADHLARIEESEQERARMIAEIDETRTDMGA